MDTDALTGRAERRMLADLNEVALEPLLHHIHLSPERATELVGRHPDRAKTRQEHIVTGRPNWFRTVNEQAH